MMDGIWAFRCKRQGDMGTLARGFSAARTCELNGPKAG